MKKSKLTLGLITSLITMMGLASCGSYSPEGYILTYTDSNGNEQHYSADDLFGSYYNDPSSVSKMFDEVYKLIVRNYFIVEPGQETILADITKNAENDVEGLKKEAESNATTNGTSYNVEFQTLLEAKGCEDEDELLEYYIYERELTEFEDQFYNDNMDHLRDSRTDDTDGDKYAGYLQTEVPYHVSHILIKVDESSSTNYSTSKIGSSNAKDLYNVASALSTGKTSFGTIAKTSSNDEGSASNYGDLGIMDKSTGFVNEFKLGVYAYDSIYNSVTSAVAGNSGIAMSTEISDGLTNATPDGSSIGTIPYGAFEELNKYAEVETGYNNSVVNDGKSLYFPRNVYFNKYFNKHNVSVITPNTVNSGSWNGSAIVGADEVGTYNSTYASMGGFKEVDGLTVGDGTHNEVLCTTTGSPILVVRAGTGSGESGYQGIHFITVERSGLMETVNDVTLSDYYTTKYPGQEGYPTDDQGKDLQTYVNFLDQDTKGYKTRAESVESKITSFDSNLNKYIFEKYAKEQKITFLDTNIESSITTWIDNAMEKVSNQTLKSWDETWRTYIESLEVQTVQREDLLPEVCAIGYQDADHTDAGLWGNGGICGENKQ